MRQRFPLAALAAAVLAGFAATMLACLARLPESNAEWIDTSSGRVLWTTGAAGFTLMEQPGFPRLAELCDFHSGPPETAMHWVNVWSGVHYPAWLQWYPPPASPPVQVSVSMLHERLEFCLPAGRPYYSAAQQQQIKETMNRYATPAARKAIIGRTLEVVRLAEDLKPALDYVDAVWNRMQRTSAPLTPDDLPSAAGFYDNWRRYGTGH